HKYIGSKIEIRYPFDQTCSLYLYENDKPVCKLNKLDQVENSSRTVELQIISNFNMDSSDPALFILLAQSHLRDRLQRSFLSSFNQRIQLKSHLIPLQKQEIEPYINHHLSLKGCQKSPFTPHAIEAIYKNTGGLLPIQYIFVVSLWFSVFFFSFSLPNYCEFNIQCLIQVLPDVSCNMFCL
ncbi:hypothetical protein KKG56_05110, partial [bacterium]|nr:hypothetical protein [bacterium]